MSAKNTPLTQAQFDALNLSSDWQIVELNMVTLKATPGIQRKNDALGGFVSGCLNMPKTLNNNTAVAGFDFLAHEPHPKANKGEGDLNVYHYIIKRTNKATSLSSYRARIPMSPY